MLRYKTPTDGKLYTSYSELKRCSSPAATLRAVKERNDDAPRFDGPVLQFGRTRHEMWQEQSERTGRTPKEFAHLFDEKVDYVEHAFAVEIFKGVVLQFRPDAVCVDAGVVLDYKKIVGSGRQFLPSKQLIIYAYGLQLHGIRITKRVYLCERWDKDATTILGYQKFEAPLTLADMAMAPAWIRPRASLLKRLVNDYKTNREAYL